MNEKMMMIFTKEEMDRISESEDGLYLDLHQLTVKQAQRLINNLILLDRDGFSLTLIHGYNHGTKIKEMLSNDYTNKRVTNKHGVKNNPGRTVLEVTAA